MKKIINWEKFNELNVDTYRNAAKKADEYGRHDLSDRFRSRISDIKYQEYKGNIDEKLNKYSNIRPIHLTNIKGLTDSLDLRFVGFSTDMEIDVWNDNMVGIEVTLDFVELIENDYIPYSIYLYKENHEIESITIIDSGGEEYILGRFDDRRTANTIIKLIRDNFIELQKRADEIDDFDRYEELYRELMGIPVHKLLR